MEGLTSLFYYLIAIYKGYFHSVEELYFVQTDPTNG